MTLAALISELEQLYFDIDYKAVATWKERTNRKAVGTLPVYVPREIVSAAGMLPVGIMGAGSQIEIIRGDAYFQSYICQLPRSTIELALTKRFAALDGFLFPSTCDVIRNLSGMWQLLFPSAFVRYIDLPQASGSVAARYYRCDLEKLARELGALSDLPVTDASLGVAIARHNENRAALAKLYDLRARAPWTFPTREVYLLLRAANLLDIDDHTRLVERYTAAATRENRPMRDHTRVIIVGAFCEQPPLELIKTLESAGCYIVDDDWVLGPRWLQGPVDAGADPLSALAQAYLAQSVASPLKFEPGIRKGDALVEMVRARRAEGVIFCAPSFCDPALLEQPMLESALARAGIPSTAFKYAENLGQFQVIREQAGTFSDSIRLWGAT